MAKVVVDIFEPVHVANADKKKTFIFQGSFIEIFGKIFHSVAVVKTCQWVNPKFVLQNVFFFSESLVVFCCINQRVNLSEFLAVVNKLIFFRSINPVVYADSASF